MDVDHPFLRTFVQLQEMFFLINNYTDFIITTSLLITIKGLGLSFSVQNSDGVIKVNESPMSHLAKQMGNFFLSLLKLSTLFEITDHSLFS